MEKLKSFRDLGNAISKTGRKFKTTSSGALINTSNALDCQFFKSYVKCDKTQVLVGNVCPDTGRVKGLRQVTLDKFLFPKEIEKLIKAPLKIIAFQWSSNKNYSKIYTRIVSRRRLESVYPIVIDNYCEVCQDSGLDAFISVEMSEKAVRQSFETLVVTGIEVKKVLLEEL